MEITAAIEASYARQILLFQPPHWKCLWIGLRIDFLCQFLRHPLILEFTQTMSVSNWLNLGSNVRNIFESKYIHISQRVIMLRYFKFISLANHSSKMFIRLMSCRSLR